MGGRGGDSDEVGRIHRQLVGFYREKKRGKGKLERERNRKSTKKKKKKRKRKKQQNMPISEEQNIA